MTMQSALSLCGLSCQRDKKKKERAQKEEEAPKRKKVKGRNKEEIREKREEKDAQALVRQFVVYIG
jgi:hypothetical protein